MASVQGQKIKMIKQKEKLDGSDISKIVANNFAWDLKFLTRGKIIEDEIRR